MFSHIESIACSLERYRLGFVDEAFHGLLELEPVALPELVEVYRAETNISTRRFLLNVLWQHRNPAVTPILAEALSDRESEIWQEAMDGLVAIASPEAVEMLCRGRTRQYTTDHEGQVFSDWLEEAIAQASADKNQIS